MWLKGDYFNDELDKEEVDENAVRDWSGEKINCWNILRFIGPSKNRYLIRCDCGNEFVRNIYPILANKSQRCLRCGIKKRFGK